MAQIKKFTLIQIIVLVFNFPISFASNVVSVVVGENRFLLENVYSISSGDVIAICTGITVGFIALFTILIVATIDSQNKRRNSSATKQRPSRTLSVRYFLGLLYIKFNSMKKFRIVNWFI